MSDRKSFLDEIKFDIDYSKIDLEKYRNNKKTEDSEDDPNKGERERVKWEEREERERKKNLNADQTSNAILAHEIDSEKRDMLIDKIIELESEYLGIKQPEICDYSYMDKKNEPDYGFFSNVSGIKKFEDGSLMKVESNTIYINTAIPFRTQSDYKELINTVIHELRHAYQDAAQKNKSNYSEISDISKAYLQYSDDNYLEDDKRGRYWFNGLEWDARSFASERTEIYMRYTADEILGLKKAPVRIAKNQILMDAGDISPSGQIAPVSTSITFSEFTSNKKNKEGGNFFMGVNGGTDFSEAAQEKAAAKYGEVIEGIHAFSENVITHFIERIKGHPYKQLEDAGNVFINSYNEELPRKVKDAIKSWCESDNSFSASIAKQYDNNSESIRAAQNVESAIETKVDSCFKNIQEIKIDKPISVNAEAIISDAQYIERLSSELENIKEQWMATFQKLGEQENSLYANMEPMVVETFNKVEEEYQAVSKDIMNISEEFKEARASVITASNTQAVNVKNNINKNIADQYRTRRKQKH